MNGKTLNIYDQLNLFSLDHDKELSNRQVFLATSFHSKKEEEIAKDILNGRIRLRFGNLIHIYIVRKFELGCLIRERGDLKNRETFKRNMESIERISLEISQKFKEIEGIYNEILYVVMQK